MTFDGDLAMKHNAWVYRLLLLIAFVAGSGFMWWWLQRRHAERIVLNDLPHTPTATMATRIEGSRRNGRSMQVTIAPD